MKEEYIVLKDNLKKLGLSKINDIFMKESVKATKDSLSHIDYLAKLVKEELESKTERSINYKLRNGKFPFIKTIDGFDFSFQPSVNKASIQNLCSLDFLNHAENILLIGPPGVGKTHLAIGLGVELCRNRIRTLFITAKDLIDNLLIAYQNNSLIQELDKYSRLPLLIIDELGFLPISKEGANLFFQLISKKYEHTSIIITSNKPFSDWGSVFNDDVIASAIIDRLVHHSHIFKITGNSYRVKEKLNDNKDNVENN